MLIQVWVLCGSYCRFFCVIVVFLIFNYLFDMENFVLYDFVFFFFIVELEVIRVILFDLDQFEELKIIGQYVNLIIL